MLYAFLASGLVEAGADVTVMTNATTADLEEPFPAQPYSPPRIIRFPNPFVRKLGLFNKLMEYACYSVQVLVRLLLGSRVDQIFVASNPPLMAIPLGLVARIRGSRVIYNLQDLFPDSALSLHILAENSWLYRLLKLGERWNFRLSNRILTISDGFAERAKSRAPNCDVLVIPNWVDTEFMGIIPPGQNRFRAHLGKPNCFLALYAGNMGYAHNLDILVEAAYLLRDEPGIHFVLVGEGNAKAAAENLAHGYDLRNVSFLPFQPFAWLPDLHNACDVGLVAMRDGAETSSIPSKTWNYLACSRPVIACVARPSDLATALDVSRAGLVVSPCDPAMLAEAVIRLFRDKALREEMGRNGRCYVTETIGRPATVKRYCDAILH